MRRYIVAMAVQWWTFCIHTRQVVWVRNLSRARGSLCVEISYRPFEAMLDVGGKTRNVCGVLEELFPVVNLSNRRHHPQTEFVLAPFKLIHYRWSRNAHVLLDQIYLHTFKNGPQKPYIFSNSNAISRVPKSLFRISLIGSKKKIIVNVNV